MTSSGSSRASRRPDEHELVRQIAASAELTELISAATAPATAAELVGEDAALAQFLTARAGHSPQRRGRPARRTVLAASGVLGVVLA
nr:hypothetical protein [Actinomycetota bacterium]